MNIAPFDFVFLLKAEIVRKNKLFRKVKLKMKKISKKTKSIIVLIVGMVVVLATLWFAMYFCNTGNYGDPENLPQRVPYADSVLEDDLTEINQHNVND